MTDKVTQFEQIKELVLLGYTNEEIADTLGISPNSGYIRRVRRSLARLNETQCNENAELLTLRKYYKAMKQHNGTKEELATELNISRMTLHRFEQATGANKAVAEYLHFRGLSICEIAKILGAKESTIEEMELTNLPTFAGIKEQLKSALEVLEKMVECDDEIAMQYYEFKRIFDKIK